MMFFVRNRCCAVWVASTCLLCACGSDMVSPSNAAQTNVAATVEFSLHNQSVSLPVLISCTDGVYGVGLRAQATPGKDATVDVLRWTGSPPDEEGLKAVISYDVAGGRYLASDDVSRDGEWLSWSGEFTFLKKTDTGSRKAGKVPASVRFKCS